MTKSCPPARSILPSLFDVCRTLLSSFSFTQDKIIKVASGHDVDVIVDRRSCRQSFWQEIEAPVRVCTFGLASVRTETSTLAIVDILSPAAGFLSPLSQNHRVIPDLAGLKSAFGTVWPPS